MCSTGARARLTWKRTPRGLSGFMDAPNLRRTPCSSAQTRAISSCALRGFAAHSEITSSRQCFDSPESAPNCGLSMTNMEIRHLLPILPRSFASSCRVSWTRRRGQQEFGVFHTVNEGAASWYRFALAIMEGAARRGAAGVACAAHKDRRLSNQGTAARPIRCYRRRNCMPYMAFAFGIGELALSDCLDQLIGPANNGARPDFAKFLRRY